MQRFAETAEPKKPNTGSTTDTVASTGQPSDAPGSTTEKKPAAKPEPATENPAPTGAVVVRDNEPAAPAPIPYLMVGTEITTAVQDPKRGRDFVLAILAKYGAAKGPQLQEKDYAAVLAELKGGL